MGTPHVKVRRHSKIQELPQEAQEEVNRMLIEGATYEDIAAHFKGKGFDLSRSGVGRYGKDFLNQVREVRIIQDQARTLVDDAGGDALVLEEAGTKLLSKKVIELLMSNGVTMKQISGIMVGFSMLQRSSVAREQLKANIEKKVKKTADAVARIAQKGGLSEKAAEDIRGQILGISK